MARKQFYLVKREAPKHAARWESLGFAAGHARAGDTIHLSAGTYELTDLDLKQVRLVGDGPDVTHIVFGHGALKINRVLIQGAAAIEKLSIDCPGQIAYVQTGRTLLLFDAKLGGGMILTPAYERDRISFGVRLPKAMSEDPRHGHGWRNADPIEVQSVDDL